MGAAISKAKSDIYSSKRTTSSVRKPPPPCEANSAATVGLGSFWLGQSIAGNGRIVEHKETQALYVLSSMPKKGDANAFVAKRDILEQVDHPFVASLRYSFQDAQNLYIATDLVAGGTLRSHMNEGVLFGENAVKLWAAELASALHYMHMAHGVACRNLSASTVLLDRRGHAVISGLDSVLAAVSTSPASDLLFAEDWRALGVLMYECIYGRHPFAHNGKHPNDVAYFPVVAGQRTTHDCMSAIRGLLNSDATGAGLGNSSEGMRKLRMHPFFATLDWELLEERQHCSLYIPQNSNAISVAATFAGGNFHPLKVVHSNRRVAEFLDYDHSEYLGFKQCYFNRDAMPEEVIVGGRALVRNSQRRTSCMTPPRGVPVDPHTWGSMLPLQQQLAVRYSAKLDKTYELFSTLGEEDSQHHQGSVDLDSMLQSMYSLTSGSLLTTARAGGGGGGGGEAAAAAAAAVASSRRLSPTVSRNASNASMCTYKKSTVVATTPSRSPSNASLMKVMSTASLLSSSRNASNASLANKENISQHPQQPGQKKPPPPSTHQLHHYLQSCQRKQQQQQQQQQKQQQQQQLQQPRYILTAAGPRPMLTSGTMPRLKPIASAEWNRPQSPARMGSPVSPPPTTKTTATTTRPKKEPSSHLSISQQRYQRSGCNQKPDEFIDFHDWEIITA